MMDVNSLPKTVTRQRRGCDLNPGPSVPESSTLTTRLPSHPAGEHQLKLPNQLIDTGHRMSLLEVAPTNLAQTTRQPVAEWLGALDPGAKGPGFKSQPRRCRVTVLGKLFTPIVPLFTKQRNW